MIPEADSAAAQRYDAVLGRLQADGWARSPLSDLRLFQAVPSGIVSWDRMVRRRVFVPLAEITEVRLLLARAEAIAAGIAPEMELLAMQERLFTFTLRYLRENADAAEMISRCPHLHPPCIVARARGMGFAQPDEPFPSAESAEIVMSDVHRNKGEAAPSV